MKPTKIPSSPRVSAPGLETTVGDSSSGRTSAANTGECTLEEPPVQTTGDGLGGDSVLGSPSHMAPEQTTGAEKAGPADDQYALGTTLYEMLTGRPPFRESSIIDTIDLVRNAEPVSPSQLLPRMPRDLETICLKALQKDSARQYPDVAAMAEYLRRFRTGEPIVARPISGPERVWRWCRRSPKVAGLGAAVAMLVLFGLIGATAAAIVIAGKNRALNRANIDLVAAKETAEKHRLKDENAQQRAEGEEAGRHRREGRDPAKPRRRRGPA